MLRLLALIAISTSLLSAAPRYLAGLALTGPLAGIDAPRPPQPVNIPLPDVEPVKGVSITCSPGPRSMNKNLPEGVIRWSCGINNQTEQAREVTEAMMVTAMLSAGVGAVGTASVSLHAGERVRLGPWRRISRYLTDLALPLALAVAGDVVVLTTAEARVVTGLAVGLPRIAELFMERSEVLPVPVWTEAVSLPPGSFILRQGYSGEWDGPTPVSVVIP